MCSSDLRSPALPDLPTMSEQGLPEASINGWYAFLAPARTPRVIGDKLNAEISRILQTPQVRDILARKFLRRGERERLLLGDAAASLHRGADLQHGVDGIDRGGTGVFEGLKNGLDVLREGRGVFSGKGPRALRESVSRRRANRAREIGRAHV